MSNLILITTETFNNLPYNFYRNMNDDILLTREQIGQALEYVYPDDALSKIHKRHSDRLDPLSVVVRLASTDGKMYDTTLYSERGIMEICRWSNKPKANDFMDWVWDIIESYRNNTLSLQNINMKTFTNILTSLSNTQVVMMQTLNLLNEKITNLEEQFKPKRKYSYWTSKMFPKYKKLMDHLGYESNGELYRYLYKEFDTTYPDYNTHQVVDDYCYENKLETCFTLDAIEHDKTVRKLFESMVDNMLEKYNLIS
nr:MAG TPA: BRO family protein [Caudoviricetes sp.]